jgi:hypothetical protein
MFSGRVVILQTFCIIRGIELCGNKFRTYYWYIADILKKNVYRRYESSELCHAMAELPRLRV